MSKWRIFNKSKNKIIENNDENTQEQINYQESCEEIQNTENNQQTENQTLEVEKEPTDYHKTLYSEKKTKTKKEKKEGYNKQRVWRDVTAIEEEIDKIHLRKARRPTTNLEKKVDRIIDKK